MTPPPTKADNRCPKCKVDIGVPKHWVVRCRMCDTPLKRVRVIGDSIIHEYYRVK